MKSGILPLVGSDSSSPNSPSADLTGSSEHDLTDGTELTELVVEDKNAKSDMHNAQLFSFPLSPSL